tara:strand:+ start:365 stop:1024 length:660 start_codon:yes stop_codon:yes gene_type:complete
MALFAVTMAAAAPAGAKCPLGDALHRAEAWMPLTFNGIEPNRFTVDGDGIVVNSKMSASMLYADVSTVDFDTLSWTWTSDGALPPMDLREKGGDDRRLAVSVAFEYENPSESIFRKAIRQMLETIYGANLPGRVISYTWASENAVGTVFDNPYSGADAKTSVIRSGSDTAASMVTVMPKADYRRLFGEDPPPISFIAVFADTDGTGASVTSRLSDLCLR